MQGVAPHSVQAQDRQAEAVNYINAPCWCWLGPVSDKTSVITTTIAHLIEKCGIKTRNIITVILTNKATRDMEERGGELMKGHVPMI